MGRCASRVAHFTGQPRSAVSGPSDTACPGEVAPRPTLDAARSEAKPSGVRSDLAEAGGASRASDGAGLWVVRSGRTWPALFHRSAADRVSHTGCLAPARDRRSRSPRLRLEAPGSGKTSAPASAETGLVRVDRIVRDRRAPVGLARTPLCFRRLSGSMRSRRPVRSGDGSKTLGLLACRRDRARNSTLRAFCELAIKNQRVSLRCSSAHVVRARARAHSSEIVVGTPKGSVLVVSGITR